MAPSPRGRRVTDRSERVPHEPQHRRPGLPRPGLVRPVPPHRGGRRLPGLRAHPRHAPGPLMVAYDDTVDLVFNHPKLDQVEVVAREVDLDTYTRALWLISDDRNLVRPDNVEHHRELGDIVAGSIVSWNLDVPRSDPPEPLPITGDAVHALPKLLR